MIAKGIVISNKIGRGRKDRAAGGGRDEGEVLKAGPRRGLSDPAQCRAFAGASPARRRRRGEERREEKSGMGAGAPGQGRAAGLKGDFVGSPAGARSRSKFAAWRGLYTWVGAAGGRLWCWRAIGLLLIC